MTTGGSETREKQRRVREMMDREDLSAVALSSTANFAWFACGGANHVGIASEVGAAAALVTREAQYLVCDNIEAARIAEEEVAEQGIEVVTGEWHHSSMESLIRGVVGSGRLGADTPIEGAVDVAASLDECRRSLTPEEIERYSWLGRNTGECLAEACRLVEKGMSEYEIAGLMDGLLYARGITPILALVAADDRIARYRHPLPTDKKLERYAMLVTGARKWGLVISATRLVHFGPIPAELRVKHEAVTRVDAAFIAASKPGARMGDVFDRALREYRDTGFADEWRLHHQGGPTGYKSRESRVTSSTDAVVAADQALAWNPSITGTKSEDTIIATATGPEIVSESADWPLIDVQIDGATVRRPSILAR